MQEYILEHAFTNTGWRTDVLIAIADDGEITRLTPHNREKQVPILHGYAIPGIPNTHSHAFQRALAGLTEFHRGERDNFWSWREMMYRLAGMVSVEQLYCIARQLYMEMLKSGYTTVAEFHYLHHQADGSHYAHQAEMALALLQAAGDTGIGLTLLPALYVSSGFGEPSVRRPQQSRFYHSAEAFCRLLAGLQPAFTDNTQLRLGCAFHSLRAVPAAAMNTVLDYLQAQDDAAAPVHIHIAEQTGEVDACLAWSKQRPVEWLLQHHDVGPRWSLVHATHINQAETRALATSGAVVSLCPTTEANLGDGIFPLAGYLEHGGKIAIGSDSNISVSPVEEMRWLEYAQRLVLKQRNVTAASVAGTSSGDALMQRILAGGAQACRQKIGAIAPGFRADILFLDPEASQLQSKAHRYLLDSFLFCGNDTPVRDVMTAGRWVVRDYRHCRQTEINNNYKNTIKALYSRLGDMD